MRTLRRAHGGELSTALPLMSCVRAACRRETCRPWKPLGRPSTASASGRDSLFASVYTETLSPARYAAEPCALAALSFFRSSSLLVAAQLVQHTRLPGGAVGPVTTGAALYVVHAQVDGKVVGSVRSRALCESLQSIYMGSDPVSLDAKQSFAEGLSHMLAAPGQ